MHNLFECSFISVFFYFYSNCLCLWWYKCLPKFYTSQTSWWPWTCEALEVPFNCFLLLFVFFLWFIAFPLYFHVCNQNMWDICCHCSMVYVIIFSSKPMVFLIICFSYVPSSRSNERQAIWGYFFFCLWWSKCLPIYFLFWKNIDDL